MAVFETIQKKTFCFNCKRQAESITCFRPRKLYTRMH